MKKIDSFINKYSLAKTLQFELIPQGKTLENFKNNVYLEQDKKRETLYKNVKKYIDEYHKHFIDEALANLKINISAYAEIYYKANKTDADKDALKAESTNLRKNVLNELSKHPDFKKLFGKELITEVLPSFLTDEDKKNDTEFFNRFNTYFRGFNENRKNLYTAEEQSTAIPYRIINDNLPKFLDNAKNFAKIIEKLPEHSLTEIMETWKDKLPFGVEGLFKLENFSFIATQKGISTYNEVIGGFTLETGQKIQGVNEHVNLYNQPKAKNERLPQLTVLFKQILSDRITVSFIPEQFKNDEELLLAVNEVYNNLCEDTLPKISNLFNDLKNYNPSTIYIKNDSAITTLSQKITSNWRTVKDKWEIEYDGMQNMQKIKDMEKYLEKREKAWKAFSSFSVAKLNEYLGENAVVEYFEESINTSLNAIYESYDKAHQLLNSSHEQRVKRLAKADKDIELIKNLLDSIKQLEWIMQAFYDDKNATDKDANFYVEFNAHYEKLHEIDKLYDKVRNHITKKPYSKDKIKLNFENPQFLAGWAVDLENARSAQIFIRDGRYYLAIKNKGFDMSKPYKNPISADDVMQKMVYRQIASPSKDLPNLLEIDGKTVKKNGRKEKTGAHAGENIILEELRNKYLPADINEIRKTRAFSLQSEHFSKEALEKYIKYYIDRATAYYSELSFIFKLPREYKSYNEFIADVDAQAYQLQFVDVSYNDILEKVNSGELYLFQIYNKDFSPYSKGTPNLHTLYFKMLFDERNLRRTVYKLNGEAEMFYRFASINKEEIITHKKNEPIENKNPITKQTKPSSTFNYDLIKDRRFTKDQFSLHVPITLNFNSEGKERINLDVREHLKKSESNYVIGIDRGERHLIYVTVINDKGEIVEQYSGNIIKNELATTDYNALLNKKEEDRKKARQSWTTIEGIKDLKDGYVSQIVHKICELVVKYDAVIALEDLNEGFKQSRSKVEKSVYQKFEKMLIDKLNYYANKKAELSQNGSILKAYQLTEKFESFKKLGHQNGFIFYVSPYLTSKIDPTTGFVDLLKPKYTNEAECKQFIQKFDSIYFDNDNDMFAFEFDYHNFDRGSTDYKGAWKVYSNGNRIATHRDANGIFVDEDINLQNKWIELFNSVGIEYKNGDLKDAVLAQSGKQFFSTFMYLLRLTLQMRNSKTHSEEDYLISPVKNQNGEFYDSRNYGENSKLPANADANGAYNIARKALWAINKIKASEESNLSKVSLAITNKEWLEYTQKA